MNWKSILATALVTGLVTLATGMFLFWWQAKEPELAYSSVTSIPFTDNSQNVYIQQIDAINTGDVPIENVVLFIDFAQGKIEKYKILINSAISHSKEVKNESITLNIPTLNARESVKISLLLNSAGKNPVDPNISLRGKGVIGTPSLTLQEKFPQTYIIISIVAAYLGLGSAMFATKRGRAKFEMLLHQVVGSTVSGNQKHMIASALSMYGFPEKAREYLESSASRQYWVEADLLSADAISVKSDEIMINTIKVLEALKNLPIIASGSRAIVFYNIARIYRVLGNKEAATSNLEEARDLDKKEIERRYEIDPVFK